MASGERTGVDVAYSEGFTLGAVPVTHSSLGLAGAASYNAKYVSKVSMRSRGIVVISLRGAGTLGLGTATGTLVQYVPSARAGNLQWTITGNIPIKYRPKS